ncbi:ananain-like [Castanea sativa]|uniref:ananain-like n=1 Tax=Castanea sativa TaxID=21020 RepID=UPI003F650CFA
MSNTFSESLLSERYELWLAQYGRKHVNSEEQEKRFNIFKDNVEYIDKFNNEGNRTFKLGANKFADLTHEEFLASYTSNDIPTLSSSFNVESFDFNAVTEIPSAIDWRQRGAVTAVKDQGWGCTNSGWAFSTVAGIESLLHNKTGVLAELSVQQLIDCAVTEYTFGCNGGLAAHAYTYDKATKFQMFRISGCYAQHGTEADLLKAMAGQLVSIDLNANSREFQLYESGVFTGPCEFQKTHVANVVGYDTTADGVKYWILKNSWGTGWGEGGYMRILRDYDPSGGLCGLNQQIAWPYAK